VIDRGGAKLANMEVVLALSRALWRFSGTVGDLLLVAAAIAAGAGLVISPHLRWAAFGTATALAGLHLLR